MRIEWREGTWAMYVARSPSRVPKLAVSPSSSTSEVSQGLAQPVSLPLALSPSEISRGPSVYRRVASCRT